MQLRLLTRRLGSYKQRQTHLTLFINGEVIDSESVSYCIQRHIKATLEELVEAMNGKLSVEDRFLLNQSLEEYQMYQALIEKLISEIQAYIAKEFP